jgi:hypothetical protein
VYAYRHYIRLAQGTQDSVRKLLGQMGTQMAHAQEALTDLEQADAFRRIHQEIQWREAEGEDVDMLDHQSPASIALKEVTRIPNIPCLPRARPPSSSRIPHPLPQLSTLSPTSRAVARMRKPPLPRHRNMRCHKCQAMGHIRSTCPFRT